MKTKVLMLIVGLFVIFGLPVVALCQEEVIEAAPADTGPPFVETEVYEADMANLQEQITAIATMPITQEDIPLTITTPGSYYLTEDVNSDETAITVGVNDVTIDLAGFAVVGPDTGTNYGIYMSGRSNVEIRNGTVRDFSYGIYENSGNGRSHRIINVRAVFNTERGIYLAGRGHLVKDCTANNNGYSAASTVYSISTGSGSTATGNTVDENGVQATGSVYGISAGGFGSTVTGNTVSNNGYSATGNVSGISAGFGSTVTGNTIYGNGYSASIVRGIATGYGSTVTGNTVDENGVQATGSVYGISAGNFGSTVTGNTVDENGVQATGSVYGIRAGHGSKVTGNTIYGNGSSVGGSVYGIHTADGCTVTSNTSFHNGTNANGTVYGIYLGEYSLVDQNTAYYNGTNATSATNMTMGVDGCVYGINVAP